MHAPTPLWRSTPPAIFTVALGFLGLGLAWHKAALVLPVPTAPGDLLMGISTTFFGFFALSYLAKVVARPRVFYEDMKTPPARGGVSAIGMGLMVLAAVLFSFGWALPVLWWAGVVVQIIVSLLVLLRMSHDAPEIRAFNPFQYLTFVGLIVAPIGGVPLGYVQASFWLSMLSLVSFIVITIGYTIKLIRVRPPQPLRPALVIVLSPLSLFAMMFMQVNEGVAAQVFYWLSWAAALVLLALARWLTKGGWTPVWGAFTFPIAAFCSMHIMAFGINGSVVALAGIWLGLSVGTPLILFIVYRAAQAWIRGDLAKKSGAATA